MVGLASTLKTLMISPSQGRRSLVTTLIDQRRQLERILVAGMRETIHLGVYSSLWKARIRRNVRPSRGALYVLEADPPEYVSPNDTVALIVPLSPMAGHP